MLRLASNFGRVRQFDGRLDDALHAVALQLAHVTPTLSPSPPLRGLFPSLRARISDLVHDDQRSIKYQTVKGCQDGRATIRGVLHANGHT